MYTCVMCKQVKDGEPAMKNGPNHCRFYCSECRTKWINLIAQKRLNHHRLPKVYIAGPVIGKCKWCGGKVSAESIEAKQGNVCNVCHENRDWLLTCIRYSDHAARYVAKAEEREAKTRKELVQENAKEIETLRDEVARLMKKLETLGRK